MYTKLMKLINKVLSRFEDSFRNSTVKTLMCVSLLLCVAFLSVSMVLVEVVNSATELLKLLPFGIVIVPQRQRNSSDN